MKTFQISILSELDLFCVKDCKLLELGKEE